MGELIELIFERVPDDAVVRLLGDLLQGAEIMDVKHSELGELDSRVGHDLMRYLEEMNVPAAIFVRATYATLIDIPIRFPLIRILRHELSNEVSVVFSADSIDESVRRLAAIKLSGAAQTLARRADVGEYYCGFEPATDERTRLFFNGQLGPMLTI